jgi:hypothetical protein
MRAIKARASYGVDATAGFPKSPSTRVAIEQKKMKRRFNRPESTSKNPIEETHLTAQIIPFRASECTTFLRNDPHDCI